MQTRIHYLHMHHICIQVATWKNLDQAFWDNDSIIFFLSSDVLLLLLWSRKSNGFCIIVTSSSWSLMILSSRSTCSGVWPTSALAQFWLVAQHTNDSNIYIFEARSLQVAEQTSKARKPSSVIASFCTETIRTRNWLPILQNLPNKLQKYTSEFYTLQCIDQELELKSKFEPQITFW